jgi:hypothetical protein
MECIFPVNGELRPGELRPGELRPGELRPGELRPRNLGRENCSLQNCGQKIAANIFFALLPYRLQFIGTLISLVDWNMQ